MNSDGDLVDPIIERWLERAPGEEHVASVLGRIVAELDATPQVRGGWRGTGLSRFLVVGATAILVVAIVLIGVGGLRDGPAPGSGPHASPGSSPASPSADIPRGSEEIVGVPRAGASPTATGATRVVLSLESNLSAGGPTMRVYENGVVLWLNWDDPSLDPHSTGFVQRRLTDEGIAYVRSLATDTGLFERDLLLHRDSTFFDMSLVTDGSSVRVVWARTDDWGLGSARDASAEEASALLALDRRLKDPAGWPPSVWADPTARTFVPALNAVCLRSLPMATTRAHLLETLPEEVAAYLVAADRSRTGDASGFPCWKVTGADLHRVIGLLDSAGIQRGERAAPQPWLRYSLRDSTVPGNEVSVMFGPVLPDGEVVVLGPN